MRKTTRVGVLSLLTFIVTAAAGNSQTPIQIAGHLATPEPLPVSDGVYDVTLAIRSEPAGGEVLWERSYPQVPIRNGRIEARFAAVPPANLDISGAWLEILVDGEVIGRATEIRANEEHHSLEFSEGYLRFESYDLHSGVGQIWYSFNPFATDEFWLQVENIDGGISLDAHGGEVWLAGDWVEILIGRLEVRGGSNATLTDGSGHLLIGFESGQNLVLDDNEIQARNNGAAATLFLQHQGGEVWVNNAQVHTSDRRKKKEIRDLDLGLDEVLQLRPVSFEWKDHAGRRRPGLVGQEVREVIEEIVIEDEEGTLGLAYGSLIPVLIRGVQEQHSEIEQLRADLAALSVQVAGG